MRVPLPLRLAALVGIAAICAACDTTDAPSPTAVTPSALPPSVTVAPVLPTTSNVQGGIIGANNFTPGASSLSTGGPSSTITPTPTQTTAVIPMTFIMTDGLVIAGTYYSAAKRPAPTLLLLHMLGSNKESWRAFATQAQAAGYNALAIDLRGHGDTGGVMDWTKAPGDVAAVVDKLRALQGVDTARISLIGASIGANLALGGCADTQQCKSVVLLSPGLDYQGVKTSDAMARYGAHPVLIVASHDDNPSGPDSAALDKLAKGDHTLKIYDGSVHGTGLFDSQPDLGKLILQWLAAH